MKTAAGADFLAAAREMMARARKQEPDTTLMICTEVVRHGGFVTEGSLDYRFKSEDSLLRKMLAEAAEFDNDPHKTASSMSDSLRYTGLFPDSPYTGGAQSVISEMKTAGYGMRVKNYWERGDCVDDQTQCLTRRGWLGPDDLRLDDEILVVDMEAGITRWSALDHIHRYEDSEYRIWKHHGLEVATTDRHNWLVQHVRPDRPAVSTSRGPKPISRGLRLVKSGQWGHYDQVPLALPHDTPQQAKWDDDLVELVAWVLCEGSYRSDYRSRSVSFGSAGSVCKSCAQRKRWGWAHEDRMTQESVTHWSVEDGSPLCEKDAQGIEVTQKVHLPRVAALMARMGVSVGRVDGIGCHQWEFGGELSVLLHEIAPDKSPTTEWLSSLTQAQLELFLAVCELADGSLVPGKGNRADRRTFVQNSGSRLDSWLTAATLAGYPVSRFSGGKCEKWQIKKRSMAMLRSMKVVETRTGSVWCPQTQYGTFVARRGDNIFLTGNSYQGVNIACTTPHGFPFELQLHTPESIDCKERLVHPIYEKWRVESNRKKKATYAFTMRDLFDAIPVPPNVLSITPYARQPMPSAADLELAASLRQTALVDSSFSYIGLHTLAGDPTTVVREKEGLVQVWRDHQWITDSEYGRYFYLGEPRADGITAEQAAVFTDEDLLAHHGSLTKRADEDQCPRCSGDSLMSGGEYTCQDCGNQWHPDDPEAKAFHDENSPTRGKPTKEGRKMDVADEFGSLFDGAISDLAPRTAAAADDDFGLMPEVSYDHTQYPPFVSDQTPEPALPVAYGDEEADKVASLLRRASVVSAATGSETSDQKATRLLAYADAAALARSQGTQMSGPDPFAHVGAIQVDNELASGAAQFLDKTALKTYTQAERNAIIAEGENEEPAGNLADLDLSGTHYVAIDAAQAKSAEQMATAMNSGRRVAEDEDMWLLDGDPNSGEF